MNRAIVIFILSLFPAVIFAKIIDEPELLWRQVLGGTALTRPSAQLDSIIVVCEGGMLKAFGSSGFFLWEYKAGGRLLPFLTRSGTGTSYICRTNGILHAVNRSGRQLWRVNLKEQLVAPPLIGWDDRVFVFLSKKLLCFTATGTQLWQHEIESPLAFAPIPDKSGGFTGVLEDGTLIMVSPFGEINALPLTAVPFAVFPLQPVTGQPEETLASVLVLYTDGKLELIEGKGGKEKVLPSTPQKAPENKELLPPLPLERLPSAPLVSAEHEGLFIVLLANGDLALVSLKQGILWNIKTELVKPYDDIEIYANEFGIYLLSKTGGESYDFHGQRLWTLRLNGNAAAPVMDERGVMYCCGKDWILYAYRVEAAKTPPPVSALTEYNLKAPGNYGLGSPPLDATAGSGENTYLLEFLLDTIENRVKDGNLGEMEPEYTKLLLGVAGSVSRNPGNTALRLKALGILSLIGSRETIPFLAGLFRRERDMRIKAAVAEAIGTIGVDPEGLALDVLAEAIVPSKTYLQESLLLSIAMSTGKLCRFSGPPVSERGVKLLVNLSGYTQPRRVRLRAKQELRLCMNSDRG
jgi:outer membrane protein assembly factor BamB